MTHHIKKILGSMALFVFFFVGAWIATDVAESVVLGGIESARASLGCCGDSPFLTNRQDFGPGWIDVTSGFGGFGGGGGGGGGTPQAPSCTLDLTKDKITWTTTKATSVNIIPLTNSPAVPGAHATPNPAPGTVVFSGTWESVKFGKKTELENELRANGVPGATVNTDHGFHADKVTADRICSVLYPGTVNGTYKSRTYTSPADNTVFIWNGSLWSAHSAASKNSHFSGADTFTCVVPGSSQSPYDLNGFKDFIPPLGVGTHTYKLTATGPGGSKTCQATVIVPPSPPPPAPGCVEVLKETFDPSGTKLTPVAQFSFKLDGTTTVTSDANGYAKFSNVAPGTHTVTEVNPGSAWHQLNVTPSGGVVTVQSGSVCSAVVFKNQQVVPPPPNTPWCDLFGTSLPVGAGNPTTIHYASSHATTFTINNGVGSLNPVTDGTFEVTPTATTTYTGTASGPSGTATCSWTINVVPPPPPPPPDAPNCTLSADPDSLTSGNSTTLSWTTSHAVSFEVNHAIGAVTPVGAGSTTTPALSTTTTYIGTATNAHGDTATCSTTVGVVPPPGPFCSLSVSASSINPGDDISISWASANVTDGSINHGIGSTSPVSSGTIANIFPSDDTEYVGTFTGPNGTISCSATVTIKKGGGGCSGNCGGGLNQPNVSLAKAPGGQILGASFVSLSQIPYTGFEAGPLLTVLFWLAVAVWSIGIAYIFVGKGSMRFIAEQTLSFIRAHDISRESEDEKFPASFMDREERDNTLYKRGANHVQTDLAVYAPSVPSPLPERNPAPAPSLPELTDVIESRAHAAGVLLSPEAIAAVAALSMERTETLRLFGDILNEAIRTIPREDGWILLSVERTRALIADVVSPAESSGEAKMSNASPSHTSVAPVLDDSVVTRFVSSLLSGDREGAFALLSSLEHEQASSSKFATGVATTLDHLYRARKNVGVFADMTLKEKAATITDTSLQALVEVFAHALDSVYASKYTGLKIAVAQAFDIRAT